LDEQRIFCVGIKRPLGLGIANLVLIILLAALSGGSRAANACLTRQQCIESHAGYCRHHAGCWHAGRTASVAAPRPKPRPFNPNPYGDPLWRDLETNPHGDPAWWDAAPNDRIEDAFGSWVSQMKSVPKP
jgi:hypothetical protein